MFSFSQQMWKSPAERITCSAQDSIGPQSYSCKHICRCFRIITPAGMTDSDYWPGIMPVKRHFRCTLVYDSPWKQLRNWNREPTKLYWPMLEPVGQGWWTTSNESNNGNRPVLRETYRFRIWRRYHRNLKFGVSSWNLDGGGISIAYDSSCLGYTV